MTGNESRERRFNHRAFVSMVAAISGIGLPVTGFMNHVYQFAPFTAARHGWMGLHNGLGIFFAVFAIWHVALNRRAFVGYFRNAVRDLPMLRREIALALVIVAVTVIIAGHGFHAGDIDVR